MRAVRRRRLQLREQALQVVRRMLHVEEQPVEAGTGDHLDAVVRGQARPQAALRLACGKRAFAAVAWQFHYHCRFAVIPATAGTPLKSLEDPLLSAINGATRSRPSGDDGG